MKCSGKLIWEIFTELTNHWDSRLLIDLKDKLKDQFWEMHKNYEKKSNSWAKEIARCPLHGIIGKAWQNLWWLLDSIQVAPFIGLPLTKLFTTLQGKNIKCSKLTVMQMVPINHNASELFSTGEYNFYNSNSHMNQL